MRSLIPWALIVAVQAAIAFRGNAWLSALAFPLAGTILALIYGLASGYWN